MGKKKYGEEMSKIVPFIPKGQRTIEDIYIQDGGNPHDKSSNVHDENATRRIFGQEKFYIRPTDEGYDELRETKIGQSLSSKKGGGSKKRQKASVSKYGKTPSSKQGKKPVIRSKDPNYSKVVATERRKAIVESLKPSKGHRRVALMSVVMGVLLVMFISFFYVSSRVTSVQYSNLELKKEYEKKLYEKKELETILESSNRSDIIEQIAREQLGMSYPRPDQIVYIKSN